MAMCMLVASCLIRQGRIDSVQVVGGASGMAHDEQGRMAQIFVSFSKTFTHVYSFLYSFLSYMQSVCCTATSQCFQRTVILGVLAIYFRPCSQVSNILRACDGFAACARAITPRVQPGADSPLVAFSIGMLAWASSDLLLVPSKGIRMPVH